ncbi:Calcium-transporting ATPase type 2C member 1 [Trichinella spiralis]|uniref:Calcium-transporting ATPase type 2C member 1 n=1 Tax=Trichinella spiralis TaxID=6334 RepID=A0A0V1AW85_TRISP|nr:Calcium-transporting ATPase type 2C member 1 [Trichinella spiralis]
MAEEALSTRVAAKMPIEEVQRWLKTDALNGLSEMDVRARSALHGFNELLVEEKEPVYKKYIDQFKNPLILLLLASAAISVLTGQLDDAVSITVAILIVVTVAFVQAVELEIDESSFTGETVPARKWTSQSTVGLDLKSVNDLKNIVFMGTLVQRGRGKGIVIVTENTVAKKHGSSWQTVVILFFRYNYFHISNRCHLRSQTVGNVHHSGQIGCVCNSSTVVNGELRGQPTEGALIVLAKKAKLFHVREEYKITEEMPFSSETKWMAVRCYCATTNSPAVYYVKGATDRILAMCSSYLKNGQTKQLDLASVEIFQNDAKRMASGGLRVIAFAQGLTMGDLVYVGMVGLLDPPRAGVRESVETVRSTGVQVKMITGDALETATAVAERLCLCESGKNFALSGEQLDQMNTVDLERVIGNVSIFYRASPKHKLKIVKSLQDLGHVVAMTGDGVNDAVALKKADIGIAMGTTGTDVSKEAADMILITDDFSSIRSKSIDCCSSAIEEGKGIFNNIRNFVRFQLSTSIAALSLIALSTVFQLPNPLNAMQILWINIIMDGPPAQSLGVEPVDKEIISQPPRNVQEPMLTKSVISSIVLSSLTIITGTMWIFIDQLSDNKITPRDTTMTFTLFVFFDMWNALSCRSQKLISDVGFFRNRMFLISVFGSIVGQFLVIYLPALQAIFQTEALHFQGCRILFAYFYFSVHLSLCRYINITAIHLR